MDSGVGRFGVRAVAAIVAAVAAFTMASTADAKPSATTKIVVYRNEQAPPPQTALAWGRLESSKPACTANRKVKLIGKMPNGKVKSLDSGRSSDEGAISAFYSAKAAEKAKRLYFLAAKTKGCAKGKRQVPPPGPILLPKGNAVDTFPNIIGVDGKGPDGAFAGFVGLSGRVECFAKRKVVLSADGTVLDEGTTTNHGAWALHVTADEFNESNPPTFRVKVRKDRAPDGTVCRAGSSIFETGPSPN